MKNIFTEEREIKTTKLHHALITFLILVVVMSVGIKVYEVDPHIPMFIGVIAAAVMAMVLGYKWADIEKMMVDGISKAMQSILILAIVGWPAGILHLLVLVSGVSSILASNAFLRPATAAFPQEAR